MGSNPVWLAIRTIHSLQNYRDGLQSGLVAGRHNPVLKVLGDRLSSTGQAPKAVVVGAVMRKLAHLIYGVIKSGRPFEANFNQSVLAIQDDI